MEQYLIDIVGRMLRRMQYLKKRDDYIDIMKGSTMGLVVWAHINLPGGGHYQLPPYAAVLSLVRSLL